MGLDPRTPGSCPGPKAGAKPLSHPGIPEFGMYFEDKAGMWEKKEPRMMSRLLFKVLGKLQYHLLKGAKL